LIEFFLLSLSSSFSSSEKKVDHAEVILLFTLKIKKITD